jgi:hypothetical protein
MNLLPQHAIGMRHALTAWATLCTGTVAVQMTVKARWPERRSRRRGRCSRVALRRDGQGPMVRSDLTWSAVTLSFLSL